LRSRRAFLRSEEVTHEIDVSVLWNVREWLSGLVKSNILFDQTFIGELDALDELLFPPTIESIAHAGFPLQSRSEFLSFAFQKVFGFFVVRVDHHRKIETESSCDVSDTGREMALLARTLYPARPEEEFNRLLKLILAEPARVWNRDAIREFLKLSCVPIAVFELGQGH